MNPSCKNKNNGFSDQTLLWLGKVLRERFGDQLQLVDVGENRLKISMGCEKEISIANDLTTFKDNGPNMPCGHWDAGKSGWELPLNQPLPTPGMANLPTAVVQEVTLGYEIHYPVLGMIWWILSRQEELECSDLDRHGRFPANASHAFRHGYLERPIVDEWLIVLEQIVQRVWPGFVPRTRKPTVVVSHDVDRPSRYGFSSFGKLIRKSVGDALRQKAPSKLILGPWIRNNSRRRLHPLDQFNTFDWLMDVSEQHGLASAFYFICGRTDPELDADYELEHPAIRDLIRNIHARNHEIGLHPSYNTYQNSELISAEAKRLFKICGEENVTQDSWGGRMHYLRWQPSTMKSWEMAGMDYDSTLGFAEQPGFRCGTCYDYPGFDAIEGKPLQIRVRPLIAMECSVTSPAYLDLGTGEQAFEKFSDLKKACTRVGGNFTLLWHNSELYTNDLRDLYTQVLSC